MSIRIVTDSTADIPPEIAELHQIEVVPLLVMFGDEQFRDGVDINSERFFRRLVREHCESAAFIPIETTMESLNVSNAAAIALYELRRVGTSK